MLTGGVAKDVGVSGVATAVEGVPALACEEEEAIVERSTMRASPKSQS